MTTTFGNNSYWNNITSDQLFDIDQLFASDFGLNQFDNYDQTCMLTKEEYEGISSSSSPEVNYSKYYFT